MIETPWLKRPHDTDGHAENGKVDEEAIEEVPAIEGKQSEIAIRGMAFTANCNVIGVHTNRLCLYLAFAVRGGPVGTGVAQQIASARAVAARFRDYTL